jgi:hypothetical protein
MACRFQVEINFRQNAESEFCHSTQLRQIQFARSIALLFQ